MNQNKSYQQFQNQADDAPIGQPIYQNYQQQQDQPYFQQPRFIPMQQNPQMGQPINPQFTNQHRPPMQMPRQVNPNFPMDVVCQCCQSRVTTIVNQQSGNTTYLWAACLCLCFQNCCCCPFIIDGCLDKVHYCPNCGHNIVRKHQKCFDFMN